MIFRDRKEAGRLLAEMLLPHNYPRPLVLALPRGGVPVGEEVAKALRAPLDTLVVRKIGAPGNPEYGLGALAPDNTFVLDEAAVRGAGAHKKEINAVIKAESAELERRMRTYKSGEYSKDYNPKTLIIVDDGVAMGMSAKAAIEYAKKVWPSVRVVFAAPVCARDSARRLRKEAEVVCVQEVSDLVAIGIWYQDFEQVTDEEVLSCLQRGRFSGV